MIDSENASMHIALGPMREATAKLSIAEWLTERVLIPQGYTAAVQRLIEHTDMHLAVVTMLQQAAEVATTAAEGRTVDEATLSALRLSIDVASRLAFGEGASCRCGWDGEGKHMCHRCHLAPGSLRVYQFRHTWGCDQCWATRGGK